MSVISISKIQPLMYKSVLNDADNFSDAVSNNQVVWAWKYDSWTSIALHLCRIWVGRQSRDIRKMYIIIINTSIKTYKYLDQ